MWPKALAQLIEVLPHLSRLLPLADRFLQSKTSDNDASRTALEQMADGMRDDLGQVAAAHAGLYRQLNDQSVQLSTVAAELRGTRASLDSAHTRITTLERQNSILQLGVAVALVLLLVNIAFAIVLLRR